ncbi:MAG: MarR family transcriptional regulator [Solirubrobacteraceae bacterium]
MNTGSGETAAAASAATGLSAAGTSDMLDAGPGEGAGAPPFRSVGFLASSIGYAVSRRFRQTLAPLELEPREFALLRAVGVAEGQSQQAIGERLQIPPSRMVAFVDALEGRSLLERRHNPLDRRTRELHLTPAGRQLLERAFQLAAGLENDLCADLSVPEREQLIGLLQRVGLQLGLPPGSHGAHAHPAMVDGGGDCEENGLTR